VTPGFVNTILEAEALRASARVLVTFMYWFAGIGFALEPSGAKAMMVGFGLQPAWLIAALTTGGAGPGRPAHYPRPAGLA
jgi:uncharacterized membrane protein YphA (DoxX/SURF4 family)